MLWTFMTRCWKANPKERPSLSTIDTVVNALEPRRRALLIGTNGPLDDENIFSRSYELRMLDQHRDVDILGICSSISV